MAINNYNDPLGKPYYQAEIIPDDDDKDEPLVKELVLNDWISGCTLTRQIDLKKTDAIQFERIDILMREAIAKNGFYILGIALTQLKEGERGFYYYDGTSLKDHIKDSYKNIDSQDNVDEVLFLRVDGLDGNYDYIGSERAMISNTAVSALFNIYLNVEEKLPKAYYDLACCYEKKNKSSSLSPEQRSHYVNQQMHYFKLAADRGYPEANNKLAAVYIQACQFENAITYLEKAIEQGSADAHYVLAKLYFEKIPAQREKCLPLFETVLKLNDKPPARLLYYIGTCYLKGIGTVIDLQKALEILEEASKANVPEAKHELGLFYLSKSDYPKAFEYFNVAAKLGNIESEFQLALMHFNGQYEPKSGCFAIFKTLAEKSHFPKAFFYLAHCYEQGIGCEKSPKDAKTYYEKAAKQNDPKALYRLEIEKLDGAQRDKEFAQAQKLFKNNTNDDERNSKAFFFLAKKYDKTQNPKEAIAYYKESAKLGYAPAMYIVGKAFFEGSYGLAKSLDDAENILLKAKSQEGVPYLLAKIYEEKKEFKKALEIYRSKNHPEYLFRLYQIYTDGLCNVEKSEQDGLNYLKKAANKGHLEAKSILEEMAKNERPFKKWENWENYFDEDGILYNLDIPKDLLPKIRESAERGRVQDQYNLALLFIQGSATVPIDNKEGQKWLSTSLKQDFALSFILKGNLSDPFDRLNALKCFLKAVPHPEACFYLFSIYAMGDQNIQKDTNKSLEYLEKAYQAGYPEAIYTKALMLLDAKKIEEGLELLNKARDKGSPEANVFLAECYRTNKFGLGLNPKKAFSLFLEGVNRNQYHSIYMAARCYQEGIGVKKSKDNANKLLAKLNTPHAFKIYCLAAFLSSDNSSLIDRESTKKFLVSAAERGLMKAMRTLAVGYENGLLFELNPKNAFEWWKKLADLGDEYAFLKVATAYGKGIGVASDAFKAKEYYLKAASMQVTEAMLDVGIFLSKGECGFEKDPIKSFELMLKAAEMGNQKAIFNTSVNYFNGIGVEKDSVKALEYLRRSTDPLAYFNMALFYLNGLLNEKPNIEEGLKFLKKGAGVKEPRCLIKLAKIYVLGEYGVPVNKELGKIYLMEALKTEHTDAYLLAGEGYRFGIYGFEKDYSKGIEYFTKAANQGLALAMGHLGQAHRFGYGVERSGAKELYWYQKAIERGLGFLYYDLGLLYLAGADDLEKDEKKAFDAFKAGADDYAICTFKVAECYENGIGVEANSELAKKWYLKAVEKKSREAMVSVAKHYREGTCGFEQDMQKAYDLMETANNLEPSKVDVTLRRKN